MSRQEKAKSVGLLDTLFGRPKNRTNSVTNVRGAGFTGSGNSISSSSDATNHGSGDAALEQEEALLAVIEKMDEVTLCAKFEEMLNDMNLSEDKKQPIRLQPFQNKKKMVINHYKGMSQENKSKFDKPMDYINYLSQNDLSSSKLFNCVESLRIALTNNPLSWIEEFGTQGLKTILNILNVYNRNGGPPNIRYECLRCLNAIMNNTVGLKNMLVVKDSFSIVARSLDPKNPIVMCEAVKALVTFCFVPSGHEKVLEAISIVSDFKDRFAPIIEGLSNPKHEQMRVVCFQFINAIISQAEDLDFRLHLRNEVVRAGLSEIIDSLRLDSSQDLMVQVKVFDNLRVEDFDEFYARFDNVRLEMDDVNDCFEVIKNVTFDTPAEPYFLSILQHLLFIKDDNIIRPAYFKLIEECVTQIVLHKNGLDPDFTKRFEIDVQPLIETLADREKSQAAENSKIEELKNKLEKEISLRQETEAKLAQAENRLKDLGGDSFTAVSNVANIAKNIHIPPPPPQPPGYGIPPPPPPPGMPGMPPPPPPMPGSVGSAAPPPPPMPGMGGPAPPPPPPMMGMGGPPPPPGFPGMMPPPPPVDVLPHGLKPKKKWDVSGPLKRANWKTILPQKMSEKAFWVKCQEDKLASPDILTGLVERFSSKPPVKRNDDVVDRCNTLKKVKDLKVLDGKAAQNISILIGGSLKHLPYSDVKKCILRCDNTILTDNVLQQLIQYLPPPDQLKKLQEYKASYDDLTEAEQFCVTISEIKRLLPRLKSLSFRLHQSEMVKDIKPEIVAGTTACEEVKNSKKFAKILELVLLLGNFMNSGSKNGQAYGFEMSFLTKLSGTKDFENKQTLLHYIVDTIESKFPDCLNFHDELSHVDKASRVSFENIQKTLRHMDASIKNLETDLVNSKVPQSEDDKFAEVMGAFSKEARQQYELLQNMFKQMDTLFTDLSEYYAFDKQKYTLEEFFSDIKTFKDQFEQAYKDNIKIREQEEKTRRAKLARENAEKERSERAKYKKQLIDMNAAQEGVMDSLMEALQTGSAFSREQKRKRGPRVAGAERRAQLNRSRSRTGLIGSTGLSRELSSEILKT